MSPPLAWKMVLVVVAQIFLLVMCKPFSHFVVFHYFPEMPGHHFPMPCHCVIIVNHLHFFFLINKTSWNIFSLVSACSIKNKFLCPRFQARMLRHGEKKCVCWFKNNGKKQHKRPQVSSHLSCKTSADRTVREFFHYPLNGPEDDYKKQPEEHGNHCSANKDNELQIRFLFSAWEEIN